MRTLSEGLVEAGHEVVVAYAKPRADDAFREFVATGSERGPGTLRFVPIEAVRPVAPVSDARAVRQVLRILRREGPFDVVHGHSSKGGAIGRIAALLGRVPAVYTPHSMIVSSPDISRRKSLVYTAAERALGYGATAALIAVSQDEADFVRSLKVVPKGRLKVIPNALRPEDFTVFDRRRGTEREGPVVFGSTMRFSEQKAPQNLIEAFRRVRERLPKGSVRLEVAGDGELLPECRRLVAKLGLGEEVSLHGWSSRVGDFLCRLDVFVVCSQYEAGVSYSTMEAMAAGLPVVSTAVFGSGLVGEVEGNRVVEVGNVEELAGAMVGMCAGRSPDDALRELARVGERNHRFARENFDQRLATERTVGVYRELVRTSR